MNLTRNDCKLLRALINRALLGPAWFNDSPSQSVVLRSMHYELKRQTAEWLMANVVRELNNLMPTDERVSLAGMHAALQQAGLHNLAPAAAVPEAPAPAEHLEESPASNPAAGHPDEAAFRPGKEQEQAREPQQFEAEPRSLQCKNCQQVPWRCLCSERARY